jgi:acyl dehydratase
MSGPFFEDLHSGYRIESPGLEMTIADITAFAAQWDPQPFHLSEEGGKNSIFGRLVASGVHTYAATMRLSAEAGAFSGNAVGLSVDRIEFPCPVYPGDVLTVVLTVSSLRGSVSKPGYGIVKWDLMTTDQSGRRVFGAKVTNLVRRRPDRPDSTKG